MHRKLSGHHQHMDDRIQDLKQDMMITKRQDEWTDSRSLQC